MNKSIQRKTNLLNRGAHKLKHYFIQLILFSTVFIPLQFHNCFWHTFLNSIIITMFTSRFHNARYSQNISPNPRNNNATQISTKDTIHSLILLFTYTTH